MPAAKGPAAGAPTSRRLRRERLRSALLKVAASLPLAVLLGFGAILLAKALPVLGTGLDLFGPAWKPDSGSFGLWPFIAGTFSVTFLALLFAVPVCRKSAFYLTFYAGRRLRAASITLLDILAGVPSVIFGIWGVLVVVPFVKDVVSPALGAVLGFLPFFAPGRSMGYSVLSGALVLALMVVPYMLSLMAESLRAVPSGYFEAALSVGATRWEAARSAVLPRARKGLFAATILGVSRAIGETMAVLMVVGNVPSAPLSVFDPAYPLPALIANEYGEMLSVPRQGAALMGAALVLLVLVGVFNVAARLIMRRIIARSAL